MKKITEDTRGECDFCRYTQNTAMDVFGRIESEFAITGSVIMCVSVFLLGLFVCFLFVFLLSW